MIQLDKMRRLWIFFTPDSIKNNTQMKRFFLTIHIVLVRLLLTSKKKLQCVKYTYHRLHLKTILMKFISQVALEKDLKRNKIKQVKNRTEFLYARTQKKLKSYCRVNSNVSLTDTFEKLAWTEVSWVSYDSSGRLFNGNKY